MVIELIRITENTQSINLFKLKKITIQQKLYLHSFVTAIYLYFSKLLEKGS